MCAASSEASPLLSGSFAISGGYLPVSGPLGSPSVTTLDLATGIDFIDWLGSSPTPGTPGDFFVNSATKDFAPLKNTFGKIQDFTFSGSGPFPTTPLVWFQSVGGVTFDLTSVGVTLQNADFLILTGMGVFHEAGFDPTPGTFKLSANATDGSYSFAASDGTSSVPEPSSALMLGGALIAGCLYGRRRRSA
jgi:hypothetical protein